MATKRKKWKSINKIVMSIIESSADEEFCNAEDFSGAESSGASNDSLYREHNQRDKSGEDNAADEGECYYAITDSDSEESYFVNSDGSSDENEGRDSDDNNINNFQVNDQQQLCRQLAACATRNRWSRSSVNEMLGILRNYGLNFPRDARSLLKTPVRIPSQGKCGGDYVYCGISNGIKSVLNENNSTNGLLELSVNIDEVPLFHSSSEQLWPILGSLENSDIFIIALFYGKHKPDNVEEYLYDFIQEWNELAVDGISYQDKHFNLTIKYFLCDTPDRSFLKCIIHHTGCSSCERCCIHGTYEGRILLNEEIEYALRKDAAFRLTSYVDHQRGQLSPLANIAEINVISTFVLDYMHLVCLGVVRRILNYLKKGPVGKISALQLREISDRLIMLNGKITSEFARQPRSLQDLDRWKATEFRQFLLYTGPVVLKGIVSKELFQHFLTVNVAMTILLQESHDLRLMHLPYAKDLLQYFVHNCKNIYGNTFTVYNVHNLLHIADDCENFNCSWNDISCFPYENFLQRIKKCVRSSINPEAQVAKRHFEYQQCFGQLRKKLLFTKVSTNAKDNCFLLNDLSIAFVKVKHNDGPLECDVINQRYVDSLYSLPTDSKTFNVYLLTSKNRNKNEERILRIEDFQKECVCLPERRGLAIFALLHNTERY